MNKVMVVGHPHSGYQDVEKLLNSCGVSQAQDSQNENISPIELGSILCKAHSVVPFEQATGEQIIQQISIGAVWNGMVLDLFRGNLDQPLWGWSDPDAIHFLEYWKEIDPQLIFVLVYNHPRTALSLDPNSTYDLTSTTLERRITKWQNYNAALLHFFHRNKDRSLLVHAHQVSTSAKNYVQQVRKHIRNTQSFNADMLLTYPDVGDSEHEMIAEQGNTTALSKENQSWLQTVESDHEDSLKQFLAGEITEQYPKAGQLYEEMQAVANLPAEESGNRLHSLAAWRIMSEVYSRSQNLQNRSLEQQKQIEILIESKHILERQKQESAEENKLLLQQLHQVQEELEKQYFDNEKKSKKLEELKLELKVNSEQQKHIDDLKEQVEKLHNENKNKEQQLQQTQQQTDSTKELQEENELLLLQLHQVQEELEHYFLENQKLTTHQKPIYKGAAERLKKDLPYKLGAEMIERSRKIWQLPFLPITLMQLALQYRKDQQKNSEDLPPLTEYSDYHEAEKAQKHLSYRLGETWLKHIQTPWGWFWMPFALFNSYRAFQKYRRENKK